MKQIDPGIIELIETFESGYKEKNQEKLSDFMQSGNLSTSIFPTLLNFIHK